MEFPGFTRINVDDCVGKTVVASYFRCDKFAARFTDGTYFFIGLSTNDVAALFDDQDFSLSPLLAQQLGMIDGDQCRQIMDNMKRKAIAQEEERLRQQYEYLKTKFEGTPAPTGEPIS
jgi:hypothetical protein